MAGGDMDELGTAAGVRAVLDRAAGRVEDGIAPRPAIPVEDRIEPPAVIGRARALVVPALRAAVDRLDGEYMRKIAAYHLGWLDAEGQPVSGDGVGGKAIRPTLAVLSAEAGGGSASDGVPAAVAVELVHNFSLLHDDIMDRDVERRHRPTAWVVFGDGQAILAGNAMLTAAIDVLVRDGVAGQRSLACLLSAVESLISGQSADLALGSRDEVDMVTTAEVLAMEAGKTAALLACSASIGAIAAGAPTPVVDGLAAYGHELGIAFQLVDDILGITGDAAATGKSSSSDVRAGKRSAPIVAALTSGTHASTLLARLLTAGPPTSDDDVTYATKLIDEAGGLEWAADEADRRLALALARLAEISKFSVPAGTTSDLAALARYVVERDR
jgi:geranylgeranyl diphosphate synthase, type I